MYPPVAPAKNDIYAICPIVVSPYSYVYVLRAALKHVPSWNIFQIGLVCRSEKCAFLKHVSDWHHANFVISRADDNMSFLTITFEVALRLLLKNKQTNKQRHAAWPYFWSPLTNFYASGPCIYHATSIWQTLHGADLKHVSQMHIFQNGTPCQSETCFGMARFRMARNICIACTRALHNILIILLQVSYIMLYKIHNTYPSLHSLIKRKNYSICYVPCHKHILYYSHNNNTYYT